MKRSLVFLLISKLSKVYFSNISNKEIKYKKIIFDAFKDMGGVYIKFLQVLCINQSFMKGWGSPKEFEVFNKVNIEPIDLSCYIKEDDFLYIEKQPFACGSFAQLYKARLKTEEDVALKILRPSVKKNLKKDLKEIRKIVNIFSCFSSNSLLNYKDAFEEFSENCLLEIDYKREMSNMKYFYKFYRGHSYVVIPKVYESISNENVIVQEYINGPSLADLISDVDTNESLYTRVFKLIGSDIWKQLIVAGGEALRTAMTSEYVFGDPHPGNIILLPENKIAFVDFGIIAEKPISQEAFYLWMKSYYDILNGKLDYGKLLQTTYMCFCPDLANAFKKIAINNDFIDSLSGAINHKAKGIDRNVEIDDFVNKGHLVTVFTKFVDNKNSLNIKLDMRNFRLLKAMQAFLSSVTTIDNNEGESKFSRIMMSSMEYALLYCERNKVNNDIVNTSKYGVGESYELLVDTLSSLAEGDEFLFEEISERMFL